MGIFSKIEQVSANTLKSIFMDTNKLIAESELQILEWEARIETEKRFLTKLTARAHQQAIAAAEQAQLEADALRDEVLKAQAIAAKHGNTFDERIEPTVPEPVFKEPPPFQK